MTKFECRVVLREDPSKFQSSFQREIEQQTDGVARLPYSFHLDRLSPLPLPPRLTVLSFLVELRHSPNAIPFLPWHVADAFIYKYQCCRAHAYVRACVRVLVLRSSGQWSRRSFPRAERKEGKKEGRESLSILIALANRVPQPSTPRR